MKTKLEKFKVCEDCYCVELVHIDCACAFSNYKTIELEFEVCKCCGSLIEDGNPADTPFNNRQLKNHNEKI